MKFLIILFILGATSAWKNYDGYQLLEVTPETSFHVEFLRNLMFTRDELDFWLEPRRIDRPVQVMVGPEYVGQLKWTFELQGLKITVIHENMRDVVGDEPRINDKPEHRVYDYDDYNTFADFLTEIDRLNEICSQRTDITISCYTDVIGQSSEGRDLKMLIIETGATHNFWIDSCIHAREWLACATVMNIVNKMLTDESQESVTVLQSHNWYILPVFNPDGYDYTWTNDRFWRKSRSENAGSSCIGTDLNRNHDYQWGTGGSSTSPCSDTYRGSSAASEVEVSTVESYASGIDNLRGWLTFHTTGQYWLVPYGDCEYDPEFGTDALSVAMETCNAIENTHGTNWDCGNSCIELYGTSGTTADWAMGEIRVKYSYTPELRGPGFDPPPSAIPPSLEEIWNGLVAKIDAIAAIEG